MWLRYPDTLFRALLIFACVLPVMGVKATTLNFQGMITEGTCSVSLDRAQLPLRNITLTELLPGQLVAAEPFTLFVTDCTGSGTGSLTPVITISGPGRLQNGRWLFRNADSGVSGAGIMVIHSDSLPQYTIPEVQNGTTLTLAGAGQLPSAQSLSFYAGITCAISGCQGIQPGTLSATLIFDFIYK